MGLRVVWLSIAVALTCGCGARPPVLERVEPSHVPGGTKTQVVLHGQELQGSLLYVDGEPQLDSIATPERLEAELPAAARGALLLHAQRKKTKSNPLSVTVGNSMPVIHSPGALRVRPSETLIWELGATDFDGDPLEISLETTSSVITLEGRRVTVRAPATRTSTVVRGRLIASDGIDRATLDFEVSVDPDHVPPVLIGIVPTAVAGGEPFLLTVSGRDFEPGCEVAVDGAALPTRMVSAERLEADAPGLARGERNVRVACGTDRTASVVLLVSNSVPHIVPPSATRIAEGEPLELSVSVEDLDGDPLRVRVEGLPPGARFLEASRTLTFRPDFTQGGFTHSIAVIASDRESEQRARFELIVDDTVRPPAPVITQTTDLGDRLVLVVEQTTDAFLDSPGHAGRRFSARVVVPKDATASRQKSVRVSLHGFDGAPSGQGDAQEFRISAHDPHNTYWWGYAESLPNQTAGRTPPYTARRVLHLVSWLLSTYPGADPERVFMDGGSMGGAGAATIGLLWARHFAMVEASIGQVIPRNHRPTRIAQLTNLWGAPGADTPDDEGLSAWDRMDLVRAVIEEPEARDQFIFTKHGKDDPTIHFGAVTLPSARMGLSWYRAIEAMHVAHDSVWDEGGHGSLDPVLGESWWDGGWNRLSDPEAFLRRNLAFPAFSRSSWNEDPGDGTGNGRQPWSPERGFAGVVSVAGDTGWSGAVAGALNRGLRWDSRGIVDTWARFEVPLRVKMGASKPPPRAGYPRRGDPEVGPLPVLVDVTPRRVQRFKLLPRETVNWQFGDLTGTAAADENGAVTIPQLPLRTELTTLVLTRRE